LLSETTDFVNNIAYQAHPQFWEKPWARRGGRFLRTPRRWFLPRAGGLQPIFFGSPSVPPSFAENTGCPRENSFPPGFLIHRSPRRAFLGGENWGWAKVACLFVWRRFLSRAKLVLAKAGIGRSVRAVREPPLHPFRIEPSVPPFLFSEFCCPDRRNEYDRDQTARGNPRRDSGR